MSDPVQVAAEDRLAGLFREYAGTPANSVDALPGDGSDRRVFRLRSAGGSVIGIAHADARENLAFVTFTRHFRAHGLPVPEILADDLEQGVYLEQDLGSTNLFAMIESRRSATGLAPEIVAVYRKAIEWLPVFQAVAGPSLDYSVCYPRARFDRQSMAWDLNYFKYHFLKLVKVAFDEQALERDFQALIEFLVEADAEYFLYRDLQSSNIMIVAGEPFFIDYQGGRRGALQYDVASLLYDAKADIGPETRDALLDHYLQAVARHTPVRPDRFRHHYHGFVLIRLMQAMGAFGYRGLFERKRQFLQSVPYAVKTLESLLSELALPVDVPELQKALRRIVQAAHIREIGATHVPLTVRISSFSFRDGYPAPSTHGGGFVFDCRLLPNPGRFVQFSQRSGLDPDVRAWLEREESVHAFMTHVRDLVEQAVETYRQRNFTELSVSFGCTAGRHRSVFCASLLADFLRRRQVVVDLVHRDL
jgi:aminoglycoside/choline kinase family phosphotransferase